MLQSVNVSSSIKVRLQVVSYNVTAWMLARVEANLRYVQQSSNLSKLGTCTKPRSTFPARQHIHAYRQTHRQRQTYKQTDRETDKQTNSLYCTQRLSAYSNTVFLSLFSSAHDRPCGHLLRWFWYQKLSEMYSFAHLGHLKQPRVPTCHKWLSVCLSVCLSLFVFKVTGTGY